MVTIRLFAGLRERAGRSEWTMALDRPAPVRELLIRLCSEIPALAEALDPKSILTAVNQAMADSETPVCDGDELAIMPPFSGGDHSGSIPGSPPAVQAPWTRVQSDDFSIDDELRRIRSVSGRIGGIAVFLGTARDFSRGRSVLRMAYEHFPGLTEQTLADIRERALKQFEIIEAGIIHRTGEIPAGGNIVLILAAAEHRAEAFRACRWCIDELKAVAPIWKKEFTPEGDVWVEGCA
ncbi:MAG TPA: molybdenum cofactor biosynthesis protein MoaE [Nitrospiria bacterium]